jgi:hypothetical protein
MTMTRTQELELRLFLTSRDLEAAEQRAARGAAFLREAQQIQAVFGGWLYWNAEGLRGQFVIAENPFAVCDCDYDGTCKACRRDEDVAGLYLVHPREWVEALELRFNRYTSNGPRLSGEWFFTSGDTIVNRDNDCDVRCVEVPGLAATMKACEIY